MEWARRRRNHSSIGCGRGEAETDPIKKARIAQFLKEYWGAKEGNNQWLRQNGGSKTIDDVSEFIGETKRTTERLIKLNDLIPELQSLVSSGKLGTTAAEQQALPLCRVISFS